MDLRRRQWWVIFLFLSYLLAAIVVTWPLTREWGSALPGSSNDSLVHFWNGWWVRKALGAGQSPYYSQYIFYPNGISLILHNLAWFTILPWLVLQLFLPGVVAYNLVLLINLALCGLATSLLVRELTRSRMVAFTMGLLYLAWPFRTTQLDHPNLISTYWLPVTLLFLVRWQKNGRWRDALAAGIALALVGYTRWQMLIPAAFVIAVYLLGTIPVWVHSRRQWTGLLLTAGLASILLAPPALMLAREWQTTVTSSDDLLREGEETIMQTDLLAYATPGDNHPLWGEVFDPIYDRYYADRSASRRFRAYIGLTAVILAGLGLWRNWRRSLPWLLVALTMVALAMGSVLRIGGQLYPEIPTLYRLLEPFYVVRLIRVPDRFNVTLALPVAVMASYGMLYALSRLKAQRARHLATLLLSFLVFFEYLAIPVPLLDVRQSPVYDQLAREPSGALLDLPVDAQRAKVYMFAQTRHGWPIVQGKVARIPPGTYAYMDSQPWLATLRQTNEMAPWFGNVSQHLQALARDNVKHILLHKTLADPDRVLHWQRYLAMDPWYEDDTVAVYTTTPRAGTDFAILQELVPGLGPAQVWLANACVHPGDTIAADVAWGTSQAINSDYDIELRLVDASGRTMARERTAASFSGLPADSLIWSYLSLESSPQLAEGQYALSLALVAADSDDEAPANESAWQIAELQVSESPCRDPDLPADAVPLDARFGDQLRLLGYEIERDSDQMWITLYWRLMQHMDNDYKVFVHVFEPSTGIPVAQDDMMPHRGGYPTRFWAAGETVVDRIPIQFNDNEIAAGRYGIAVGVYDPQTLERLTLRDGNGQTVEDGRLVLPDETVIIGDAQESNE